MRKRRPYSYHLLYPSLVWIFIIFILTTLTAAEQSSFRQEFIQRHQAQQFDALEYLVRINKEIIPGEIKQIVYEAMAGDKGFKERIELLDVALKMAVMYDHAHGDFKEVVKGINDLMLVEIDRYEKKVAEETKWFKMEERFLGNLIIANKIKAMEAEGMAPVVYPHWIHRIWFKCKVCHDGIFINKKGSNNITKAQILEGKQCGVCHNGKIAFAAKEACERCHVAGKPEGERMFNIENVDHGRIKEVAQRLGAEWNIENLPGKTIPVDSFNLIDWVKLKEMKVINPLPSLDKEFKEEIRETKIFFKANSLSVLDVLFDHKVHSWWLNCSTCHNRIFKDELGANNVSMVDLSRGKYCGECHMKVSFTFADCLRCHTQNPGKPADNTLIHTTPASREGSIPK